LGDALAILSTSTDNAAEITLIQKGSNDPGAGVSELVRSWKSTGADQVIFNGPKWDALITRDRPSGQATGGRIWNMPDDFERCA